MHYSMEYFDIHGKTKRLFPLCVVCEDLCLVMMTVFVPAGSRIVAAKSICS